VSTRRHWLVSVRLNDSNTGVKRSVLVRIVQAGLAITIALVALTSVQVMLAAHQALAGPRSTEICGGGPAPPPPTPTPPCHPPTSSVSVLALAVSDQVVRPNTEVTYTYTATNSSSTHTLIDCVVEDSHLGIIPPAYFTIPPVQQATLTASTRLTQNRTSVATLTCSIEWDDVMVTGGPATTTVHVIEGISLTEIYTEPPPVYHGDATTLCYSVANQDPDDGVVSGTVLVTDSLGRTLDEVYLDLDPATIVPRSSPSFTVPQDVVITITATGWDDVQRTLPVSDQTMITLCPTDIYEPDDSFRVSHLIHPDDQPQLHDFSRNQDQDWIRLQLPRGDPLAYAFIARPLASSGFPISMTFYQGLSRLAHADNLADPQLPVRIGRILWCTAIEGCDYFLQIESPASGCWTDYEVWVEETSAQVPLLHLASSAQVVRPGTEVAYTYTVSNPSTIHTLTGCVVEDSQVGVISPTHFTLTAGEKATLTATATLTQNRTSVATLACGVEEYDGTISASPVSIAVHVIEGISLTQVYAEPLPADQGDITTLYYSVVNQDPDDGIISSTVLIIDSLGRTLDEVHFELDPAATIAQSSLPFTVPQDIIVTLTATGWDDVRQVLSVTDQATLTLRLRRRIWMPLVSRGS